MGYAVITQTMVATGVGTFSPVSSSFVTIQGLFNVTLNGTGAVGTVKLEKSFDNGVTWFDVARDSAGTLASYALSGNEAAFQLTEPESQVVYRANCTAYTSGTITCRISQ